MGLLRDTSLVLPHGARAAGLDADARAWASAFDLIEEHAQLTRAAAAPGSDLLSGLLLPPPGIADALLVLRSESASASADLARRAGTLGALGSDLVNRCVNSMLAAGAMPHSLSVCFAAGWPSPVVTEEVLSGVARGARANAVTLADMEFSALPAARAAELTLDATILGSVPRGRALDGRAVAPGDVLFALNAVGPDGVGLPLAEQVLVERARLRLEQPLPGTGTSLARALVAGPKSYFGVLRTPVLGGWLHALAPVAHGGLRGSLSRVLPRHLGAEVDLASWSLPPLFALLRAHAGLPREELVDAFNMGLGLLAVVGPEHAARFDKLMSAWNEPHWAIGRVTETAGAIAWSGDFRDAPSGSH